MELKFPAPSKTGNYQYSVILRSDSFLGLDQIKPLKVTVQVFTTGDKPDVVCVCVMSSTLCPQLEVHEAKAMLDNHPQWDIPDTEEEDDEQEDSDGIEESEDDDEDND